MVIEHHPRRFRSRPILRKGRPNPPYRVESFSRAAKLQIFFGISWASGEGLEPVGLRDPLYPIDSAGTTVHALERNRRREHRSRIEAGFVIEQQIQQARSSGRHRYRRESPNSMILTQKLHQREDRALAGGISPHAVFGSRGAIALGHRNSGIQNRLTKRRARGALVPPGGVGADRGTVAVEKNDSAIPIVRPGLHSKETPLSVDLEMLQRNGSSSLLEAKACPQERRPAGKQCCHRNLLCEPTSLYNSYIARSVRSSRRPSSWPIKTKL